MNLLQFIALIEGIIMMVAVFTTANDNVNSLRITACILAMMILLSVAIRIGCSDLLKKTISLTKEVKDDKI